MRGPWFLKGPSRQRKIIIITITSKTNHLISYINTTFVITLCIIYFEEVYIMAKLWGAAVTGLQAIPYKERLKMLDLRIVAYRREDPGDT